MNSQKDLWEKLAKKNSRYYVFTDKGKGVSEDEFKASGKTDYDKYILQDDLITKDSINQDILEIGCGTGRVLEFMAYDFNQVVGVDISGEMIRQASVRLEKYKNISLFETDGYKLPFTDETFGVVFSYLVFQHFKDVFMLQRNFEEAYRVLKPGGIFKVRVRTDVQESLDPWWSGVAMDLKAAEVLSGRLGFKIVKSESVADYGLWLWLQK